MNIVEAAQKLMNGEYGDNISREFSDELEDNNLVVVQGRSDDIMIFDGAILDEFYSTVYLKNGEILKNKCEDNNCPYFKEKIRGAKYVKPVWHGTGNPDWYYETNIPYATFNVYDEGDFYCRGIVFSLEDT